MRDTVVLDYALPPNAVLSKRRRYAVLRHTLLLFLGAALGGMFGRALSPVTYRGTALYQVPFPGGAAGVPLAQVRGAEGAHLAKMQNAAVLDAALAELQAEGHAVPSGPAGHRFLTRNLQVQPIPNSTLFQVDFDSHNMLLANAAPGALASAATTLTVNGGTPNRFGMTVTQPRRSPLGVAIGAVSVAAGLIIRLRRRQRIQPELAGGDTFAT